MFTGERSGELWGGAGSRLRKHDLSCFRGRPTRRWCNDCGRNVSRDFWLVFKWPAITILSLIALVAVVIGGWVGVNWLTYDRYVEQVQFKSLRTKRTARTTNGRSMC